MRRIATVATTSLALTVFATLAGLAIASTRRWPPRASRAMLKARQRGP